MSRDNEREKRKPSFSMSGSEDSEEDQVDEDSDTDDDANAQMAEIERLQAPADRPAFRVHPWHTLLSGSANTSPHQ